MSTPDRAWRGGSTGDPRDRLLRDGPLRHRAVVAAGVRTAVLTGGDGPPLVLLHGGIECGGVSWTPVASRLARSHRLVVPDLPGLGESEPAGEGGAAFDRWLADVIARMCEDAPALVAHSLGGSLAARFAIRHAALLQALVIYAAPGVGRYRMPIGLRVAAARCAMRPSERNLRRFEGWAFHDPQRTRRRDPEWHDAFVAYTCSRARAPHVRRAMRSLLAQGTRRIADDDLRRIATPTALLWGRYDRMVPMAVANAAACRLGVALHVVEDAGHVPHVESPCAFADALHRAVPTRRATGAAADGP
ncbi:MAG: alpha/beta fold hydrolase [Solirubrobacterales bacterium]